jgi:acyl-CoA thioester hydrolase
MADSQVVETTFHVRYAETDQMGIAHHSVYIVWFEEGRSAYMRQRGVDYARVEAEGYYLMVSKLGARFLRPALYGDRVTVRTSVSAMRSRALTFVYEVVNADTQETLVTGHTTLICVDRDKQVRPIPDLVRQIGYAKEAGTIEGGGD